MEKGVASEELKDRMMSLLDEVKTKDAKEALLAIAAGAPTERLKQRATQVLNQNFPGALAPAQVQPAKGNKGGKK